ncbi:MAG: hypothetical protein CL946_03700, partial [Ectothiorhodospiraceae bacterium]|nr:hypothetical protein [Ectothiorhodospiraceae bacterium]
MITKSTYISLSTVLLAALGLLFCLTVARAQERELRGVWLTTLQGLDWPNPGLRGKAEAQKKALAVILDDIAAMNLNTVYFQVRTRGNAFYRSSYEPWAAELGGRLGKDPGWDPLEYAIEQCHDRGLEIHAWVNVCKVWSHSKPGNSVPEHLVNAHPEWVARYDDDYWLDAGVPEARAYTVSVMEELIRDYDLDGIHLDYARYPEAKFDDKETYRRYGNGQALQDWRRSNINSIVRGVYDAAQRLKPGMHVGSAPIGIYTNIPGARGWEAYKVLAQDARTWLRDGYGDYAVPQLYWGMKKFGSRIDFEALVRDWCAHSAGRHIYVGTAPYKPEVGNNVTDYVKASRANGAQGIVFFRYEHIAGSKALRSIFKTKVLAPPLAWRDEVPPLPPIECIQQPAVEGHIVTWDDPGPAEDGDRPRFYAVYRGNGTGERTLV